MKILFRTNGGRQSGLGHVSRCLSLAKAFSSLNSTASIIFRVNHEITNFCSIYPTVISESYSLHDCSQIIEEHPDIVILDSYLYTEQYMNELAQSITLYVFDENNDLHDQITCTGLINGNIYAPSIDYSNVSKNAIKYLGLQFLIMKPEYWTLSSIPYSSNRENIDKKILLTTGGGDLFEIMPKFLGSLQQVPNPIQVIIGPSFSNEEIELIKHMKTSSISLVFQPHSLRETIIDSDIVICAAGSTVYEVLALHRIPIVFTFASNQELIAQALQKRGVTYLGQQDTIEWSTVAYTLQQEIIRIDQRRKKLAEIFDLIDGKGALRVAQQIISCTELPR